MKKATYLSVIILVIFAFLPSGFILGQISSGGIPASTIYSVPADDNNVISVKSPDMNVIQNEDERFPSPYRFGVLIPVDVSPETSGKWEQVPDGGSIWRASITIPGAKDFACLF